MRTVCSSIVTSIHDVIIRTVDLDVVFVDDDETAVFVAIDTAGFRKNCIGSNSKAHFRQQISVAEIA